MFCVDQKEEERLRASIRRESQQRRMKERAHARGLSSSYLEGYDEDDEDDENTISIAALKKKYKAGARRGESGWWVGCGGGGGEWWWIGVGGGYGGVVDNTLMNDENTISIAALKNKYKAGARRGESVRVVVVGGGGVVGWLITH